jgi:uncharacterized surface protein with fasciclin (FAS1) repeats
MAELEAIPAPVVRYTISDIPDATPSGYTTLRYDTDVMDVESRAVTPCVAQTWSQYPKKEECPVVITINRRTSLVGGLSVALGGLINRAASAQSAPQGMQMMNRSYEDGFTVMASDARFSTWISILQLSGLAPYARGATPYTVFAPTNEAFDQHPQIRAQLLPTAGETFPDTSVLIPLVRAHVVYGAHPLDEFMGKKITIKSLNGTPIEIDGTNPQAITVTWHSVNGQNAQGVLTGQPILASNADIYPVNTVMFVSRS